MTTLPTDDMIKCILPTVLFWNPLFELRISFTQEITCTHANCTSSLTFYQWRNGVTARARPRIIQALSCNIILVSCTYHCSAGHEVLSTDPAILEAIQEREVIPFILLHKTGFTRELVCLALGMFREGMNFKTIERVLKRSRHESLASYCLMLKQRNVSCNDSSVSDVLSTMFGHPPSDDIVRIIAIADFLEKKLMYEKEFASLTTEEGIITLDHTFKTASNIGYFRRDNTWISLYNSVVFVLNEKGHILDWQFTHSTSLDEITRLISGIQYRIHMQGKTTRMVIVDNCCTSRCKLQSILGNQTEVKLDLFHASNRITRHMSRKHPMFYQCIRDVKLLWRDPKDLGSKRQLPTPSSKQILLNIDDFLRKWQNCTVNGSKLITETVLHQLQNIQNHARKGCLSNIPVSTGTNKNEALHHKLRSQLSSITRMGVLFAVAIFSIMISDHNCSTVPLSASACTSLHGVASQSRQGHILQSGISNPIMGIARKLTMSHNESELESVQFTATDTNNMMADAIILLIMIKHCTPGNHVD